MLTHHYLEAHQRNAADLYEQMRHLNAAATRRRARRLDRVAAIVAGVAGALGAVATHFHRKARALA